VVAALRCRVVHPQGRARRSVTRGVHRKRATTNQLLADTGVRMRSQVRAIEKSPPQVVEEPVAAAGGNVRPDRASVAADGDDQGDGLDAVAGSEFVDDRIREE